MVGEFCPYTVQILIHNIKTFQNHLFICEIEQSLQVTKHLHDAFYISLTYKTVLLILPPIIPQRLIKSMEV